MPFKSKQTKKAKRLWERGGKVALGWPMAEAGVQARCVPGKVGKGLRRCPQTCLSSSRCKKHTLTLLSS